MTPQNQKQKKKDVNFDRLLLEAVEAGIESGRSMGIIEAYNFLIMEGHTAAAESMMQLITEEEEVKTSKPSA